MMCCYFNPLKITKDQFEVLTAKQRSAPQIYLEHNTPHGTAATTRHYVNDPDILLVHVTHFNRLMWDNGQTPAIVIPHGVTDSKVPYSGTYAKGFVAINHLPHRGRVLGWDIFRKVNRTIPSIWQAWEMKAMVSGKCYTRSCRK
ncbi:hypothetical protein LWM68_16470 [Niabella sp. W65]|nr:hypothetical protein [Niabella sp. W65]MCH7364209.1 hypothetical protein [Niabella sp. W65]